MLCNLGVECLTEGKELVSRAEDMFKINLAEKVGHEGSRFALANPLFKCQKGAHIIDRLIEHLLTDRLIRLHILFTLW